MLSSIEPVICLSSNTNSVQTESTALSTRLSTNKISLALRFLFFMSVPSFSSKNTIQISLFINSIKKKNISANVWIAVLQMLLVFNLLNFINKYPVLPNPIWMVF